MEVIDYLCSLWFPTSEHREILLIQTPEMHVHGSDRRFSIDPGCLLSPHPASVKR
jgi:hypothetical protein